MIHNKIYKAFLNCNKVSIDTRTIQKNDMFWALKGEAFNGNNYIDKAFEKGALYVVTDNKKYIEQNNCIYVKDSLEALQKFANFYIKKLNILILAITGTNGKTTTKELISKVLMKKYNVGYTKGNFNNHIGVPLTLLSFTSKTEIGVVEMGANHPGEIKLLCETAQPKFGIITNIGKAHLEGFGSLQGVIKAKSELYNFLNNNEGKIFINYDNEILKQLINKQEIIKYGTGNDIFCKGSIINQDFFVNCKVQFNQGEAVEINSKLLGSYNFENILATACVGKYFKVADKDIKTAIEDYVPQNNRSQLINSKKGNKIILDAYNANPASMGLALGNFKNISSKEKVLIIGDMLELGKESLKEHTKIIETVREAGFKNIHLIGECFKEASENIKLKTNMFFYENVNDLISSLEYEKINNSTLLIKGSRGIKLEKLIEYL